MCQKSKFFSLNFRAHKKNKINKTIFARCKHWSRSTSCFSLTLHKSWDKIQPTEHIKKDVFFTCEIKKSYKLKQEAFLDQCCLHLEKWSNPTPITAFRACMIPIFSNHHPEKH